MQMGPIRGNKRKIKLEIENGLASESSEEPSIDWWHEFSRKISGLVSPSKGVDQFETFFKVSRKTFNYICSLVNEPMMTKATNFSFLNGQFLSLNDQVALALRRLSSGDSLHGVANFFGTNHSTVSQVTWRFVEAIEERGLHHLQWPSTEHEISQIKSKFENVRGLPNCCGAIDTTHIMMLLSATDRTSDVWLDRKDNHSMMLQVIVDPDMRFRDVVTGWPGKMDDASVLQKSNFYHLSEKGERLNGKKLKLSEGTNVQEYIVGDSGFPLLPWLITPYQGQTRDLPETKSEFNKRHFATRLVAQMALARLKDVWRVIQGVMWRPDKNRLPRVILACCILHNIVIDMEDDVFDDDLPLTSRQHDLGYHHEVCDVADKNASIARDKLALYLSGRLLS
ncbi:protein ALP1-like [Rutidosis leptorrhynchoides]|uniref:protein ALP1-like n=1 Tax=Rutidosis leptorrhynchoides TaxID=125765 RepID=UPI003A98E02C